MRAHLEFFDWTTWAYVVCAFLWAIGLAASPTIAELTCVIAFVALAFYDYALNVAKSIFDRLVEEEAS